MLNALNLFFASVVYLTSALAPFLYMSVASYTEQSAKSKANPTNNFQDRVFAIHNSQGYGTGWVVDIGLPDLYVVTAAHVCADEPELTTTEWGLHEVVFQDMLRDVCILSFKKYQADFKARGLEPLKFAMIGPGTLDTVCAISRRDPSQEATICGTVLGYAEVDIPDWGFEYTGLRHTAPTLPGASGGPILNEKGEVVCITTMIYLLDENSPLYGTCSITPEILYSFSLYYSS